MLHHPTTVWQAILVYIEHESEKSFNYRIMLYEFDIHIQFKSYFRYKFNKNQAFLEITRINYCYNVENRIIGNAVC